MSTALARACLEVSRSRMTSKEFLDWAPRGAYTTCRTIRGTDKVFELSRHLQRLVESVQGLVPRDLHDDHKQPRLEQTLSATTIRQAALVAMNSAFRESSSLLETTDCKLTVVVALSEQTNMAVEAFAHVEPLKTATAAAEEGKPVCLVVGGRGRENAKVKDSKWVQDRKSIVSSQVEETLLVDAETGQFCLEGSQTNFFVVTHAGVVLTANRDVLEGTVRAVVLDCCRELDIPVQFDPPPKVSDLATYREAFIASTSRLVLPVDQIDQDIHYDPLNRPVTAQIQQWVRQRVEERALSVRRILQEEV